MEEEKAFIPPGTDDFGIVAVEALAAGTPVIAYRSGGAQDYINSKTGVFFDKPTTASLMKAVENFNSIKFDQSKLKDTAQKFSAQNFHHNMKDFIQKVIS